MILLWVFERGMAFLSVAQPKIIYASGRIDLAYGNVIALSESDLKRDF